MLAKHPWMIAAQRQANSTEEEISGYHRHAPSLTTSQTAMNRSRTKILIPKRNRMSRAAMEGGNSSFNANPPSQGNITHGIPDEELTNLSRRPLTTVYDQAIQRVQEWNAALNGMYSQSVGIAAKSWHSLACSWTEESHENSSA
jgi:hypothetical protein